MQMMIEWKKSQWHLDMLNWSVPYAQAFYNTLMMAGYGVELSTRLTCQAEKYDWEFLFR